ncbi:MAG: protein GumC [Deltaproteobacteria bacterium]|nr:MAG: protein GumC [Deltaproteobacteria bacterium]
MDVTDITQYLDMAQRRKWWIIIPFLLTLLAGLAYALMAPKVYRAETLILVQSPKVPQDYVRSIISTSAEDRLRTITQQVTSRTNLEKIIREYGLYSEAENKTLTLDQKVALFRKNIDIQTTRGRREGPSSFSISFSGKDPKKVMQVTNTLASNFISENLRIRESQAIGTSTFLSDELKSAERRLAEKEADLRRYREKYMGGLPEQLDTNLRILERLQEQLDQAANNLRDAENRRLALQTQLAEQEKAVAVLPPASPGAGNREPEDLLSLKSRLASLQAKYTENHPDVIRLKNMIARLEAEEPESGDSDLPVDVRPRSALGESLKRQLQNTILEIKNLKGEMKDIQSQIAWYQNKVAETPKREQELLSLKRDYDNLQEVYNSLLNRKLEAEIAVSMEKKQKGEQFRVIDPAKIPDRPVSPDMRKVILMTLALGLGLGGGLAFLKETLDTSFKTPEDLKNELQLPVLVSLPIQQTAKELKQIKRKNLLAYFATGFLFILSAVAIVMATKGVDKTMEFVRNFVSGT